jgi:hypothetical protein
MSSNMIAPATVVAVLLADGWHRVVRGSFSVGAMHFGAHADAGVLGFSFEEADNGSPYRPAALAGPLTSILAVRQAASAARHHPGELTRPATRHWTRPAPEAVA